MPPRPGRKRKRLRLSLYRSKRRRPNPNAVSKTGLPSATPIPNTTGNITYCHYNSTPGSDESIDVGTDPVYVPVSSPQHNQRMHDFRIGVDPSPRTTLLEAASDAGTPSTRLPDVNASGSSRQATSFHQNCMDVIKDDQKLKQFVDKLSDCGMLQYFMDLFNQVGAGTLSPLELPLLLAFERAHFQSIPSTTCMTFHPMTKKFFALGYNLFGNSFLEYCSGPKSHGQIITGQSERGRFDPAAAKVNFVVPNRRHLHSELEEFQKHIYPGIISQSLDLVQDRKDFILQIDGKKIARGLRPLSLIEDSIPEHAFVGDVDCWGFEEPNLSTVRDTVEAQFQSLQVSKHNFADSSTNSRLNMLEGHMKLLGSRMQQIRMQQLKIKGSLQYNEKKHQQAGAIKRYHYAISACKTYLYSMYLWTEKALTHIGKFLSCAAMIQGASGFQHLEGPCDLTAQQNVRILHEPDILQSTMSMPLDSAYVKQRSSLWHETRNKAVITGSTAYSALGFRTSDDMKWHFQQFVYRTRTRQFTEQQRQNMHYGSINEIHAQATLCSVVMPALLPACATLVEMGSLAFDGANRPHFLEVSPDGLIVFDHHDHSCSCNRDVNSDRDHIAVEIKCIVPGAFKVPVAYACPPQHVFQVLLEMFATESHLLWLCFYCKQSMTVIECDFDEELCRDLLNTIKNVFDKEHITKPTSTKHIIEEFKPRIHDYIQFYTRFLGEFPVVNGELGAMHLCSSPFNPYNIPDTLRPMCHHYDHAINEAVAPLWDETKQLILECVDLLRTEATEMLAFILTNSMRLHREHQVANVPIAYALQGYSMRTETLREMWQQVLRECYERNSSVLCTVVDGQHLNLAVKSSQGHPLTRLQLMKTIWSDSSKLSKAQLLAVIENCHRAPYKYPIEWVRTPDKPHLWLQHQKKMLARQAKQPRQPMRNKEPESLDSTQIRSLLAVRPLGSHKSSHPSSTLHHLLDSNLDSQSDSEYDVTWQPRKSILDDSNSDNMSEYMPNQSSDSSSSETPTEHHFHPAMTSILRALQTHGRAIRWHNVSVTQLVQHLSTPLQIRKLFLYELDIIRDQLRASFGRSVYTGKTDASVKYQRITDVFCPGQPHPTVEARSTPTIRVSSVLKLKSQCKKILLSPQYPKALLQVVVCSIQHRTKVSAWERASPINMQVRVPGTSFTHKLYCYPEGNSDINSVQFITFDPNHCLTNLRALICRNGFQGVTKQAFMAVSEFDNSVLPNAVVADGIDKQNVQLAERFFSQEVQQVLLTLGHLTEANFCRITREWFNSCDKRGIPQATRFAKLQQMFDFLDSKIDYADYPPPAQYIKGIPLKTFECIMHGISTKFALLQQCRKGTFSSRQITTLGVENWFSEITRREFSGLGCPKSCDIPRLIGRIVEFNMAQHDPNRGFHLNTKRKNVYPYHLMESSLSDAEISQGVREINPQGCWFDKPAARPNAGKKPKVLSGFREIAKGSRPVREHFRIDEGRIPAHKRARYSVRYDSIADII